MKDVTKDLIDNKDIGVIGLISLGLFGAKLCFNFVLKIMKGGKK